MRLPVSLAVLVAALLGSGGRAGAGERDAERVVLVEGRSARAWVPFPVSPTRMVNSAPAVLRVIPGSNPGEVVFYGRRPGRATLTLEDRGGDELVVFDVDVLDRGLADARGVLEDIPDSVRVTVHGAYVALEGTVETAEELGRVEALAASAPNVLPSVRLSRPSPRRAGIARGGALSRRHDGPEVPDVVEIESDSFERFAVTLLPGTFLLVRHPFRAAGTAQSDREVMEATSDDRQTLFVGRTPGTSLYVVRDEGDRRWRVFDVRVLDPAAPAQRRVPVLPPGVRVLLEGGDVVLEGTVAAPEDVGALEVVAATHPGAVNRVRRVEPLPDVSTSAP